jgi:hypothetical protein
MFKMLSFNKRRSLQKIHKVDKILTDARLKTTGVWQRD